MAIPAIISLFGKRDLVIVVIIAAMSITLLENLYFDAITLSATHSHHLVYLYLFIDVERAEIVRRYIVLIYAEDS